MRFLTVVNEWFCIIVPVFRRNHFFQECQLVNTLPVPDALFAEISPEQGTGYFLGIIGGIFMLLLLAYPLKKRLGAGLLPFSTRFWFRVHMTFGVLGPLFVVAHSRLELGSVNSAMAFVFMLTVMASGLVGRFLYRKIHVGLYGRRKQLEDLLEQVDALVVDMPGEGPLARELKGKALYLRNQIPRHGSLGSLLTRRRVLLTALRHFFANDKARESMVSADPHRQWLGGFELALRQCLSYHIYERLFSLWHFLHLPIFFAFVISAAVHIWAVHYY